MISLEEIQAVWRQIKVPVQGEKVDARELLNVQLPNGSPLLTIDHHSIRHVLIPVKDGAQTKNDTKSSGIHISTEQWGIFRELGLYVDIRCLKPHLAELFNLIILEIFDELLTIQSQPDQAAHRILEQWRDLIHSSSSTMPSQEEITGIFGELWFLRELCRQDSKALDAWRGPLGERYDFYNGKTAVEIKTSKQISRKTAVIHGHMQLEAPPNGNLYFLHIQLDVGTAANDSLQGLIEDLVKLGCDQRALYKKLLSLGMTSEVTTFFSEFRNNMISASLYIVDESFPKITPAYFVGSTVPVNVSDIQYRITLDNIPSLSQSVFYQTIQQFVGELNNYAVS